MLKAIKIGFGITIGCILGKATLQVVSKRILKKLAKDEKFMEREKTKDPELYEALKKYQ